MSLKNILVHVNESRHTDKRIDIAIKLAREQNAHLTGAALTGVSRFFFETIAPNLGDQDIYPYLDKLRQRAKESLGQFESTVQRFGGISFETRMIDDEPMDGLSLHARYADLVVLGQFDPDDPGQAGQAYLPEFVTMNSGCPIVLVPYSSPVSSIGERVLIAWNGSLEAKRAVYYALPILQRAKFVEIASFRTLAQDALYGEHPAADLATYLAHHNIKVDGMLEETASDVSEALLSLAANLSADLIVMGCYGHTRMREMFLGGATRKIFRSATLPILLSH